MEAQFRNCVTYGWSDFLICSSITLIDHLNALLLAFNLPLVWDLMFSNVPSFLYIDLTH